MLFRTVFFLLLLANIAPAQAADSYAVAEIRAGDEIALEGGPVLRLEGIAQPLAATKQWQDKAKQALQELAGSAVTLEDVSTDRYGRWTAQVTALDGKQNKIWLQGEMLRRGLAFVYPPTGFEARLVEMRALENAARAARIGIWSDDAYADRPANKIFSKEGGFAFARGVVLDAAEAKNMVYVHFGENWRTSLTLAIAAHDLHNFRKAGIDPLELKGKTIRARGWVRHDIGPMIVVTDPGQIEILPSP